MSGTQHNLRFGVLTTESSQWTPEHRIEFESDDDRVVRMLHEVMLKAGNAFIKAHPDLFKLDEVI